MQQYMGRSETALARAEDKAYELASAHGGAKQFHVVEVGTESEGHEGEPKGQIYVVDNDGYEKLQEDDRFDWFNAITTKGYEEDE